MDKKENNWGSFGNHEKNNNIYKETGVGFWYS